MENFYCSKCRGIVEGGFQEFQRHLRRVDHIPPYVCGQRGCAQDFSYRRTLYAHIRDHHFLAPVNPDGLQFQDGHQFQHEDLQLQVPDNGMQLFNVAAAEDGEMELQPFGQEARDDIQNFNEEEIVERNQEEIVERNEEVSLKESAELAILNFRGITYMTGVAIEEVEDECYNLIKKTASHLKSKVQSFLEKPEVTNEEKGNLLKEFSDIPDPFRSVRSKKQQLVCFKEKFGLLDPTEINLAEPRFDSRQHPKRPRFEATQVPRSFQFVGPKEILRAVMSDPDLRNLILSEKASEDGYIRSFRDGSLFAELPADLKDAIRIVLYIDDLELLQALSSRQGVYKVAGIYFGIQNLPPELNALLTNIFVTALAYAEDAKDREVWEPFHREMTELESEGDEVMGDDGEPIKYKAFLCAQIGDALAAHDIIGLLSPSCSLFCRCCYIKRREMWQDCMMVGEPRTPERHALDVQRAEGNKLMQSATGVRGSSHLDGFRIFKPIKHSIFDLFHDLPQGICKMEVKLAIREYVCIKKYFSEETLNSRIQFFDYGFPDRKNKPSATITSAYLSNIKTYNLHQTGAQMWCLTRAFGFLFGDLVPEGDRFMRLISLLNQIITIAFAHAVTEADLNNLDGLIEEHHKLFIEIFPVQPSEEACPPSEDEEEVDIPEEIFEDVHETVDADLLIENEEDTENYSGVDEADEIETEEEPRTNPTDRQTRKKKKPRRIRLLNKHHHMLHYVELMRMFGPMILYYCIRYEARHYFFKLAATVCHNFRNVLKTLMEMLQMKLCSEKNKPKTPLVMGKQGRKLHSVCDARHSALLIVAGLDRFSKVSQVNSVTLNGVTYRSDLFVTLKLQTLGRHPEFACIKALYVSKDKDQIYIITQKWRTVQFEAKYCAFHVTPGDAGDFTVHEATQFPSYRVLGRWKRYDSDKIYLAPRTIA